MTSRVDRFFVALTLLYVFGFSAAIYDPREATTKPPKRREPVLPWYLSGTPVKDYIDSSEDSNSPRSPKWQTDPDNPAPRKPIIVDSGTKTWSTWRKNPGSEIEQRTEILTERTPGVNQQERVDQHVDESFDYNQFEERENRRLSTKPGFETRKEDKGFEKPGENQVQTNVKDERDFYEGVPIDSTKPQKEKIIHSTKLKSTVARYDSQLGVQCPDFESTGQFVYPPDCKFFVNCWKGRAFVQPCAPGTLFNPNTLECDFPHKVKCYGGELADFPSSHNLDSTGRREPLITGSHSHLEHERVQVAKCPPHVTGLLPHPTDCTKFLQCANGGTFVMDCGPGTVFNSAISVCDWPHNVRGCEDSLKPNEGNGKPLTPPNPHEHFDNKRLEYNNRPSVKKIACPADFNGLLPHPDTCKKFLQCANGATFVMDCGPGTAFNPLTSVCDWPHKVPGCSENKSFTHPSINAITTAKPWPSRDSTAGRQWQSPQRYNETSPGNKPGPWPPRYNPPVTTTNPPETNWDALRPTWRPSWKPNPPTTTNPPYHRDSQDRYGHHGYYEHHESDRHKEHGRWESTGGSDHYPNRDHDGDHSTGGWDYGHRTNDRDYHQHGGENVEDSYNHHYHHHEHHHGRYPQRPYEVDDDQPAYGHPQRPPGDNQGRPDEGWHHDHHYHHQTINGHGRPWNYPDESHDFDRQVPQNPYQPDDQGSIPDRGYGGNRFDRPPTRDSTVPHDDNVQTNRRTGYEYTPNRQEYGRTSPEFNRPRFNQTPASDGNVYVDNDYGLSGNRNIDSSRNVSSWSVGGNRTVVWPAWNRTRWSAPVIPGGQGFHPSTGPGQQGQGPLPSQPQNRQWDQGTLNEEDKLREWGSRTNIYQQSTIDREADSKLDQWALRTNVFQQGKESAQTGGKSTTQDTTSPLYPNGVYVNVNGTRGHFITKEIEINQGHSNTKTYKPNGLQESNYTNAKNDGTDYHRPILPPTNLQPPYYEPPNRPRISPTLTQLPSVDTYYPPVPATNLQPPYQPSHLGSLNSTKWPTLDNQYPPVPATDLLPPYYQPPSRSQISPNSTKPRIENKYPVPSRDLQPPYFDPPSSPLDSPPFNKSSATGNKYPAVPSRHLQPPFYEPPSRPLDYPSSNDSSVSVNQYPAVPASNLQPPFYEPPSRPLDYPSSNDSSVPVNQYPAVPASNLQPPHYQHPNYLSTSSNATALPRTANQPPVVPPSDLQPPHSADTSTNFSRPIDLAGSDSNYMFTVPNVTHKVPDMYLIVPTRKKDHETTTEKAPTTIVTTTDPNIPSVSIEYEEHPSVTTFTEVEPEPDIDYDVDVLDDKEVWKPVLVFENKTKTTTESSVIMKINKKKVDVDLFNLEAPPFQDEEPPFPVYYVPPVEPISHSKKTALLTPISGQVIRLRGGSGPHDGYVEVQGVNPGWGIVCDSRNSWTLKKAHLVCKQLGYSRGAEMAWQGRNNRNGVPTWIAANSVTCHGNETRFQSCKFTHEHQCRVERDAIGVRCAQNRVAHCRKDEVPYEGQCYHLADPDSGLNHAEALDYCSRRDARLIDVISQLENDFVSEWLLQLHPEVGSIMTSGVGFTTLNRTFWLWEDASRAKFRFAKWWPGWLEDKKHPPFVGARPLCVIMKRKFPCHERPESTCVADYFFWDTEDCAASTKGHSYICKRPYDDIGCIYGKGNQYAGNANVTALGKECLPWSDEKVAHRLTVTVVNRDVREKLKTHNYCRNPNPNRESRPWCFAEPSGEREYCDIPPCGNIESKKLHLTGQCKPKHFECLPGECIPSPWVCDGEEDCTNGADEKACISHLNLFKKSARYKLEGYDVEKWLNTPLKTCALRCKEADFTCRSFVHKAVGNVCLLSDSNVGMTGSLKPNKEFDYYEMKERSINCDGMYVCGNGKCINQTQVCNGKNDCNDRTDENICTVENLDYAIRLAGSNSSYEGRVEVKILGVWGQVCDDGFGMINADVICKELGFVLGALEVRPGGFYGNLDPPTRFMVDQLKCRGNESSLRECDFDGWGVHNCQPEEAVGVICKTAVDSCQEGHWKCDNSPTCIPMPFICDEVVDCPDGSDESPNHCDAPFEIRLANGSSSLKGRVEVRHHGIWGTVCDDDFSNATAAVICRSLGYGGIAIAKKNGFFGAGEGPIWLDEVFCHGNETQLNRCEHNYWGQHNCDHNEDAGVICTPGDVNDSKLHWENVPDLPQPNANDLLPANCGKRFKDFNDDEDLIFAKVVHGSIAQKGTYPWQASIRVRGHSRSSHWCGAVILSPLHVLTAAHCLEGYNKGTYFVRAGDYNTEIDEGTEAEANIEDYYVHEDFRKGHRMNNDIALVLLKGRGIPLGKDIMPICLPSENAEYPAGLNCTISGFGSIETGKSTHSKDLRYGWIPLLDQSVCRAGHVYGEGAISDGMVCAGYLDEGVDTCDGDSGGPLACYHNGAFTLYGITSWGQHCGKANKPGVYVRVSYYRRWIDLKVRESLAGR